MAQRLEVYLKVRISTSLKQQLEKVAEEEGDGVNVSDIVRRAILEYLAKRQRAGRNKSGEAPGDASDPR